MNKSTKQKERKVIQKMAARKPKTEQTPPVQTCRHQWMTVMGDDPYHNKVICTKCGAEKKGGDDRAE